MCKTTGLILWVCGPAVNSWTSINTDRSLFGDLCEMDKGLTLVLGASPHADRYSYLATVRLVSHGHAVVAVGNRDGIVAGVPIVRAIPEGARVDTVTLYLNPVNQRQWQPRILALRPRRIIFNPGTEDDTFAAAAARAGIEVVEGCTLVMLAAGTY